ncbi:MAG: hypothetical protein K6E85_15555 [Lachnospiraceae bacterium]|nr:hypothetical protein [Lachnospiraceae bacterium]
MNRYTKLSILLIAVAGIVYFLVSFRLENVEIRNDSIYSDDEIRSKLFTGNKLDNYTYFFSWRINRSSKSNIPFVEKTDVEVVDKNSVIIYVYGKSVLGCVEHMGKYMHFDREGMVVESADRPLEGIPVIEGLEFDKVIQGEKLQMGDSDLYENLMSILKLLEKNSLKADRIVYGIRNDITLYLGADEVLLGFEGNFDLKINNLKNVLESLKKEYNGGAFRVDMRKYSEEDTEVTARLIEENEKTEE